MKPIFVTTSWDDGHTLDVRLAELLKKYGIKATFYIAPKDYESTPEERLTDAQIKTLSESFEIGAHTMTHAHLTKISDHDAKKEIEDSKHYLESITGQPVTAFCYPRGEYKKKHVEMVHAAGFLYARTVQRNSIALNDAPLEARTTVNTYNHYSDLSNITRNFQWDALAKARFDEVQKNGGVFHLWGHSWEIEEHNDWEKLESVLAYISHKPNVQYVTNSEFLALRPRKLLIAIPYFPPYHGGTQVYAYNIAKRLQNQFGWDVRIATSGARGGKVIEDEYDGLKVYRLPYWIKVSNTPINFLWPFMLKRIIKKEEFSVINAHGPVPFMSDMVGMVAGKIPFILTYHTGSMKKKYIMPNILIWLYENGPLHLLLRRADFIACPSDFVRFGFLNYYSYKSKTITPGVDMDTFRPGPRGDGPRTILFVAGLTRSEQHKGLPVLIDAFNMLHQEIPDVRLLIVGEGNMRHEYEAGVAKLGLKERVTFTGRLDNEKLVQAYQQSDLFVLPSLAPAESFGMVLVEAMASGKPVIGSKAGGIPLVIDDEKTGLLVESANSKALATAIKRLLDDPALSKQLAEAGQQKAVVQYNWGAKANQYNSLFETMPDRMQRIIQVVGYYPPHIGGMEMVAKEISLELAQQNYPVTVFTSDVGAKNLIDDERNYRVERFYTSEIAHTPILWSLPFRLLTLPKNSLLHIHVAQAGIPEAALLAAKLRKFPLVIHFHLDIGPSGSVGVLLPFYKKHFLGRVLRGASKVIVFSEDQMHLIATKYGVKESNIAIIPNGVSDAFFNKKRPLDTHDPFRILYVGRLSIQKRVERLIEAVSLTKTPVELMLVGDGEDREKLEEMTKKLGLLNVIFKGKKYGSKLICQYNKADAFAISSDIEGMPLVVLEAMAAGLPIVGSDVAGIRELVKGVGILAAEPYPENFAKAFTQLSSNPAELKKFSVQSIEKAKNYSWKKLIEKLAMVYQEISQ